MLDKVIIAPEYLAQLKEILRRHVPGAEVMAYGSRVTGGGHEASDLDLVVRALDGGKLSLEDFIKLKEALTESNIPILIEPLDWARIPESFREEILKKYVVIQEAR